MSNRKTKVPNDAKPVLYDLKTRIMKCKHKNLEHTEVIEAYHGTYYDEDGEVWFNNEYGGKIADYVKCYDCQKSWKVVKSSPKFIIDFHEKVQYDREHKM